MSDGKQKLTDFEAGLRRILKSVRGWTDYRRCNSTGADFFYPERENKSLTESVKSFCGLCPVRPQCAATGLLKREDKGYWGGLSKKERSHILAHLDLSQVPELRPTIAIPAVSSRRAA